MQIENRDTVTAEMLKAEKEPMEYACDPLGKLEFVAGVIHAMCEHGNTTINGNSTIKMNNPGAMADIIADATMELWAITDAGMNRIEALEAQVLELEAKTNTRPVKMVKGGRS